MIPNNQPDIHARITMAVTHKDGRKLTEDDPAETRTVVLPVIAWDNNGAALVAFTGHNGITSNVGGLVPARGLGAVELFINPLPVPDPLDPESDPLDVVEVIPGSSDKLEYELPDGSTFRGVVPLWGRRADGSIVALVTAEPVPVTRTIERDPDGQIVASVETSGS